MRKINFRKKSVWMRAGAFFLAVSMMFWLMPFGVLTAHAEAGVYITSITLMQGSLSAESLDESGYNVITQPLNPAGVENLYMGYQTGGESGAIRDIMVSSDGGDSIDVNGISYQKVSDVNMNDGTDGKEIYLYVSHDEQAGEPLRGLSFHVKKAQGSYSDDSYVLASDGSEIVTTDDGKLADFDEGIADSELYLRMYKGNLYRPYVDNVIVATAENEEAAVSELAAKRCTYYVNYDIGDEKSVLVGYTRTDDESEALRALVAVGGNPAELNDVQTDEDTADTSDDDAQADGSQPTDSDIVIKDIVYTMVEGGSVNSDKNYTFYMTKDENAGEPVIDLVACGYDPEELGLSGNGETEESEESVDEENTDESETPDGEDTASDGDTASGAESQGDDTTGAADGDTTGASDGDISGDTGAAQDADSAQETSDGGSQDESAGQSPDSGSTDASSEQTETVSERPLNINALGTLCVIGLDTAAISSAGEKPVEKVADVVTDQSEGEDASADAAPAENSGDLTTDAAESDVTTDAADDAGSDVTNSESNVSGEDNSDETSAGEEQSVSDDGDETEDDESDEDEKIGLADAVRIYSEVTMKDWISGYFIRGGGQTASKYLYEESEYTSAAESEDKLWISNIYCSSKKGKQFVNYIGYVSAPGMSDGSPFTEAVSYDTTDEEDAAADSEEAAVSDEADSTASVFDSGITRFAIVTMLCIALTAVIGSLAYKILKKR